MGCGAEKGRKVMLHNIQRRLWGLLLRLGLVKPGEKIFYDISH